MEMAAWLFWVAVLLMFVGLVGVLLPVFPGVFLMWSVVLVYCIVDGFVTIGIPVFVVLTVLGLGGATADIWMSMLGARVGGASIASTLCSMLGAAVGALAGLLVGGIGMFPGMIVGSLLGVFLNEFRVSRDWREAGKATLGLGVGYTLSTVVQVSIGVIMLVLFVWKGLRG
jgi:uncharacterized protein YqgC (DUF456 family)